MRTVTPAVDALLVSMRLNREKLWMERCVAIDLKTGHRLLYTTADVNVELPEVPGVVFRADGAKIEVPDMTHAVGLAVDKLTLVIVPVDSGYAEGEVVTEASSPGARVDPGQKPLLPVQLWRAAQNHALDGATVTIYRALSDTPPNIDPTTGNMAMHATAGVMVYTPAGCVLDVARAFVRRVLKTGPTRVELEVASGVERLAIDMPRLSYEPSCIWNTFDAGCQLNAADFTFTGVVQGGSTVRTVRGVPTGAQAFNAKPDDFFTEGVLSFTSGPNFGVVREITQHHGGVFVLAAALPYEPSSGEAFTVLPGDDKSLDTCEHKFNNLPRWFGFPHVPGPDSLNGFEAEEDITELIRGVRPENA